LGSSPSGPIRRGSFSSVKELIAKIEQFVAAYNKTKAPFNWTATADSILEKLQRLCSQISGTRQDATLDASLAA
jgi:putative transposase